MIVCSLTRISKVTNQESNLLGGSGQARETKAKPNENVFGDIVCFISANAYGVLDPYIRVKGHFSEFDGKSVTVFSSPRNIAVPRESIPKYYKIVPGA